MWSHIHFPVSLFLICNATAEKECGNQNVAGTTEYEECTSAPFEKTGFAFFGGTASNQSCDSDFDCFDQNLKTISVISCKTMGSDKCTKQSPRMNRVGPLRCLGIINPVLNDSVKTKHIPYHRAFQQCLAGTCRVYRVSMTCVLCSKSCESERCDGTKTAELQQRYWYVPS